MEGCFFPFGFSPLWRRVQKRDEKSLVENELSSKGVRLGRACFHVNCADNLFHSRESTSPLNFSIVFIAFVVIGYSVNEEVSTGRSGPYVDFDQV